ncbi:helix-turn-helix domain-containing protein [Flavobacteriaceae bacterium R38]|nr:helix-turn-helix domain-containing protein [Flavobacteriaceae bacterium R38]
MVYKPTSDQLRKHIDHYWVIADSDKIFNEQKSLYAYPGITPDMLIVLDGHYTFHYLGKEYQSNKSLLFSFIHDKVFLDITQLKAFIVVRFKPRGLASLLPFLEVTSGELMKNPVNFITSLFGDFTINFETYLKNLDKNEIVAHLDDWFTKAFRKEREGFVVDMAAHIDSGYNLKEIMKVTNYSYATLERYFKREAGMTPKKYQSLKRFKQTIEELYTTQNTEWMHYVAKFGYFDQSHFIKEIKKHTSFTPAQLLGVPSISSYRPVKL